MKKYLILFVTIALALAGCGKNEVTPDQSTEVAGQFQVVADKAGTTKATVDQDGNGVNVSRFIMEVYRKTANGDVLYNKIVKAAEGTGSVKTAAFEMVFVKGQEYNVLFWADAANADKSDKYYNTADLHQVQFLGSYVGNVDAMDAFFNALTLASADTQNAFTKTIKLNRPFGQLNIITTDIDDIEALSGTPVVPTKVTVGFTAPSVLNVLTGETSVDKSYTSVVAPYYNDSAAHKALADAAGKYTLSMDYIIAPKTGASVKEITMLVEDATSTLAEATFANIPVQRNYRTNIIGDLLTTKGKFVVETDPIWSEPDETIELWNPSMITPVTPDTEGVYHINLPSELAWIAQKVNAGTTFEGKTVILEKDIDLNNGAWTPIGNVVSYPGHSFLGVFDGNNKTISNLNAVDRLPNYSTAGLFGSVVGTIKNVKVKNAVIESNHYAGVICGYTSSEVCVIENCHVDGATVVSTPEFVGGEFDNGDKVGGIIGYIVVDSKVAKCSVKNVSVKAHRDLGGIVGCALSGAAAGVTENTVSDSEIIQSNKNGYKTGVTTYEAIIGRHNNDVPASNTSSNVTLSHEE